MLPYLVLLAGVVMVANSSILVRLAQGEDAPSLVIAAWRMTITMLVLTPVAWARKGAELRSLNRRSVLWALASGLFLAAHLACWIASLAYTSVASSTALVCTYPLWVALIGSFLLGEHLSRSTLLGLGSALAGALLVTFTEGGVITLDPAGPVMVHFNWDRLIAPAGKADTALPGNFLALAGGVTGAGYFLVGRSLRQTLSNLTYIWLVYGSAMVFLLVLVMVARQPMGGYSGRMYLWVILIALGPQLLGHSAFNWALAHLSATFVVLSILGEPIGSAILAYLIFGEAFAPLQLAGFVLLLVGIGLGVMGEQRRPPASESGDRLFRPGNESAGQPINKP